MRHRLFLLILFFGLAIRLILIGNTGFVADISFWKSWSLAAYDYGIVWTTENTNINYPPGFIYVLWLMGKMYSLIGNPHDYNSFWKENNFGFLFVSKSIAILSDIIIALLLYWFFSQKKILKKINFSITENKNLPLFLFSLFFLNPVVILDSALWGQVESFGILFTIVAILFLFFQKPFLATAFFITGTLMKLQNIIFIPLFFLFVWRYFNLQTLFKSLAVASLVFFLINLPFIIAGKMDKVLYLLTVNSDYFPWLSLNANNLWWIVAEGKGMQITDKITVLGILNAKTVGLFIFSSFYLLFFLLLFLKPSFRNLFLSFTLAIFAFFLFTTQSHERYSYPVIVFLLFLYPFLHRPIPQDSKPKNQEANILKSLQTNQFRNYYFWIVYFLLTLSIFFNIHMGLVYNYPQNGLHFLTRLTTPPLTILNSYFLLLLFFLLFPFLFSQISFWFFVLSLSTFGLGIFLSNYSYLTKGKVSLTSFKPIIQKQDFAFLQVNKAVSSYPGWRKWQRLAVDYFFYRKGFGTHANSKLVFDIDKKFKKFSVDMGVDIGGGTPASVIFQIYGDGQKLYESKKLGRFDFPEHAEVSIAGVKYLGLEVTDAGDGINSDHANWLNPMLYR